MTSWRSTVSSEAEQVVEHFEIPAHNETAVDCLRSDPTFQETALAHHRVSLALRVARDADGDLERDLADVEKDLLDAMRDRASTLLLAHALDVEVTA